MRNGGRPSNRPPCPVPSFDVQSLASTGLCRKIDGSSHGIACYTEMDVLIAEVIADATTNHSRSRPGPAERFGHSRERRSRTLRARWPIVGVV
jgi:hypothetical protein